MADLEQRFGMMGEIMYNSYKRKYDEINRKIKRGDLPATSSSYQELYNEMKSDLAKNIKKREQFKIKLLISLGILAILVLCTLANWDENALVYILIGAIPLILTLRGKSKRDKELDAIITFDQEYLNGAVTKT